MAFLAFAFVSLQSVAQVTTPQPRVSSDWFESPYKLFDFCIRVQFESPVCPGYILSSKTAPSDTTAALPLGELSPTSLFRAREAYLSGKNIGDWLSSLKLSSRRPAQVSKLLWDEALLLYAEYLYDRKNYREAMEAYDRILETYRLRPSFHQKRAWIQYRAGNIPGALGSLISAESPLLVSAPFPQKYFLRALMERDTCRPSEAYRTIQAGRSHIRALQVKPETWPWYILCSRKNLGRKCEQLRLAYATQLENDKNQALRNLDLLEVELLDKVPTLKSLEVENSSVTWPMYRESWRDEIGRIVVPVDSKCSNE